MATGKYDNGCGSSSKIRHAGQFCRQMGAEVIVQNTDNSPGSDVVFQCLLPGDDATLLEAARQDPLGFVEGLPERVILDEVQRAPELLLAIKAVVDRDRQPGSGSGYGLLMRFVVVYDVSDRPIVLALRLWSHP